MCLTSPSRDHQVMSSGDSTVVPSTIPNSDNTKILPTSNDIEADDTKSNTVHSQKAEKSNLLNSTSDFEQSMIPSNSSTSDSLENMAPNIREVRSLEAEEVGELKRENARSAFEITSFRPATDDLDKSVAGGRPMSTDSFTLHTVPEKGESEESLTTPTSKQPLADTQPESTLHKNTKAKLPEREPITTEKLDVGKDASQGNAGAASPKTVHATADEPASKTTSAHPPSGIAAQPGNGAGVQPNRFRRVNQYERGRWTIRDSLVTEDAAEGTPSQKQQEMKQLQQLLPSSESSHSRQLSLPSTKYHQDSSESSNGTTPPLKSTLQQRSESASEHLQVSTELTLSGITGGGLAPESASDKASDKDSSSIHMDRSSTAAETLSRNTSMSSILAPDKSVDGDEVLRDIDVDIAGNQNFSQDQDAASDVLVVSPQPPVSQIPVTHPPVMATSSAGAVPPPVSTVVSREAAPPVSAPAQENVNAEDRRARVERVENAMSFLQNELKEVLTSTVLTSSSYPSLMEENRVLKDERTQMDQARFQLESELSSTREELQLTKDENARLKNELKELRSNLTRLAGSGSTSATQSAPVKDAVTPAVPPISDDTSNSSQDAAT